VVLISSTSQNFSNKIVQEVGSNDEQVKKVPLSLSVVELSVANQSSTINTVENNSNNNDGSDGDYVQLRKFSVIEVVSKIDQNSSIEIVVKDCQEQDDDNKENDKDDPITSSTPTIAPMSPHQNPSCAVIEGVLNDNILQIIMNDYRERTDNKDDDDSESMNSSAPILSTTPPHQNPNSSN